MQVLVGLDFDAREYRRCCMYFGGRVDINSQVRAETPTTDLDLGERANIVCAKEG